MISINRITCWLIIILVAFVVIATQHILYIDEGIIMLFVLLAVIEMIHTRDLKRFKPLLFYFAFVAFYLVYSLLFAHNNTTSAVILGAVLDTKLFALLISLYCIRPHFTAADRTLLKIVTIPTLLLSIATIPMDLPYINFIFGHIMFMGASCFLCALCWLFASVPPGEKLLKKDLLMILIFIAVGLTCTRSKFYGEAIVLLFLIFFYNPGMFRHFSVSRLVLLSVFGLIMLLAVWQKFSFYFLSANVESMIFEENETMARLALYMGFILLLGMYPLFGTGFASFCTFSSVSSYSQIYYELGLNYVWGLAPDDPSFATDAYFPMLAEFGIVGVIIFIFFWIWLYRCIRAMIRRRPKQLKYVIICAIAALSGIMIEATSCAVPNQPPGEGYASILILCCVYGQRLIAENARPEDDATSDENGKHIPLRIQ